MNALDNYGLYTHLATDHFSTGVYMFSVLEFYILLQGEVFLPSCASLYARFLEILF